MNPGCVPPRQPAYAIGSSSSSESGPWRCVIVAHLLDGKDSSIDPPVCSDPGFSCLLQPPLNHLVASSISLWSSSSALCASCCVGCSVPSVQAKSPSARAAVVSLAMGPSINIIWTKVRLKALRGLSPHSGRWSMAAVTLMSNRPITGLVAPSGKQEFRAACSSATLSTSETAREAIARDLPFSCFLGFLNPVQLQITVEHSPLMFLRRHVLPNMFPTPDTVDEYGRCWKSKKNSNYQPGNYNQMTLQKYAKIAYTPS